MKQHTVCVYGVVVALALTMGLTACTDAPDSPSGASPSAASSSAPVAPNDARLAQTLWSLSDEEGVAGEPLPDDDPDVQAARDVSVLLAGVFDTRQWTDIDASLDSELSFYSDQAIDQLGGGYRAAVRDFYTNNQLSLKFVGVEWYPSTISTDRTHAIATLGGRFAFTSASESYLAQGGLELDTPYLELRRYYLHKVDGRWLVDSIERQPLERSEQAG